MCVKQNSRIFIARLHRKIRNESILHSGFNHKPGEEGRACKTDYNKGSYSEEYPKAVYFPGQQVVIVHPMKVYSF